MKKVIQHETHIKPWGKTALQVASEISGYLSCMNMPDPFSSEPPQVWMPSVYEEAKIVCDRATKNVRVGMMISSRFRIELVNNQVLIYHVRNEKEPRLFITISKV